MPRKKTEEEVATKVVKKVTGQGTTKAENLPIVSSIFDTTEVMNEAIAALEAAHSYKVQVDDLTGKLNTEKQNLTAIAVGVGVPGFRFGTKAVIVNTKSRTSFNKDKLRGLLIDAGVDPEVIGKAIEDANVEGEPYYEVRLVDLL